MPPPSFCSPPLLISGVNPRSPPSAINHHNHRRISMPVSPCLSHRTCQVAQPDPCLRRALHFASDTLLSASTHLLKPDARPVPTVAAPLPRPSSSRPRQSPALARSEPSPLLSSPLASSQGLCQAAQAASPAVQSRRSSSLPSRDLATTPHLFVSSLIESRRCTDHQTVAILAAAPSLTGSLILTLL
ncbi:hypothetical protein M0R45_006678 [Rubus argutus]|uniref:Uncharacterized protein n=1 Tax=Rubus argutus TaxID=59490 RepID=A0AAW1YRV5_RUBAR